jgi:pimeloyl-ACP methyl ester carboxylesterase
VRAIFRKALLALAGVCILGAAGIALSWAPDVPASSLRARWAQPPSKFIDVQGLSVHVRDEGPASDPQPLVLLHGTSASLHTWDGWAQVLAQQRRVIRMDLPGFGLTGPHHGRLKAAKGVDDYSTTMDAHFVLATLDALGVKEPVVLGGNSLGGQIAWEVALLAPQRVARLVLVDALGYAFTPESVPLGFRLAAIPLLNPITHNALPRATVAASVRNVYGDPNKVTQALIDRYHDLALVQGNRRALGLRMKEQRLPPAPERITQVKQPTLILWGGQDRLVPPVNAQRFANDIEGSQLLMFPNLGHVPHEEDAQTTVQAVLAFIGPK